MCWFLVFQRHATIVAPEGCACDANDVTMGVQIVAYRCDENGCVSNWTRRYQIEALDYRAALNKLAYQISNRLAALENSE